MADDDIESEREAERRVAEGGGFGEASAMPACLPSRRR